MAETARDRQVQELISRLVESKQLPWVLQIRGNPSPIVNHRDFGLTQIREGGISIGMRDDGKLETTYIKSEKRTILYFGNSYGSTFASAVVDPETLGGESIFAHRNRLVHITADMTNLWLTLVARGEVRSAASIANAVRTPGWTFLNLDTFEETRALLFESGIQSFTIGDLAFDPATPPLPAIPQSWLSRKTLVYQP